MLYFAQMSLVKPLEPSSRAAAADGPNTLMPPARSASASPATSGASGPTTTRPTPLTLQKAGHCARIVDIQRNDFGIFGDAGIARRAEQRIGQRRFGNRPGQRVFASARADQQDIHGCSPVSMLAMGPLFGIL
jgi:hypothetical protein